jgi:hypothetical protein
MVTHPENPNSLNYSHYFHASVPDHLEQLRTEAENPQDQKVVNGEKAVPMQRQRVVYESGRAPDEIEQLPENLQQPAKELIAALGNPKHALRSAAEQVVRRFALVAKKAGESKIDHSAGEFKIPEAYVVVPTLTEAAKMTGIPPDEIVTIRDIRARWNLNRSRIHEWKSTGPQGQPRLTELPVRLKGAGSGQLLFWAGDIERLVANPPKPGRPWK